MSNQPAERHSIGFAAKQIAELARLFPESVTEGKVDFDKLRAALGDAVDDRDERFSFTWAGKAAAVELLHTPSRAALVPDLESSVNFDTSRNLFIEGDNLEVLKLLFKPYFGRVKVIYIDPPYNTGQDFIYPDNYADPLATYLQLTGQMDRAGNLLTSNPETSGRYHSAWLSMMYPRLFLARQLLTEDGVIFVSIDENELPNLLLILNEAFGEENQLGIFTWIKKRKGSHLSRTLRSMTEFVLAYARDKSAVELYGEQAYAAKWQYLLNRPNAVCIRSFPANAMECTLPDHRYEPGAYGEGELAVKLLDPVEVKEGRVVNPFRMEGRFKWSQKKIEEELALGTRFAIKSHGFGPNVLRHNQAEKIKRPTTLLDSESGIGTYEDATEELRTLFGEDHVLDYPKPVSLIKYLVRSATHWSRDGLVLDFFAGSGTTGQAVWELNQEDGGNRRFILVQIPEAMDRPDFATIAQVGIERLKRAMARRKKDRDEAIDLGFRVFKLVPSHFQLWTENCERDMDSYLNQLNCQIDPLTSGWQPTSVSWELALQEGYSLTSKIETLDAGQGNLVYHVIDTDKNQSFHICLDEAIEPGLARLLRLKVDDLLICRDKALDDSAALNLALQCRLKTI